jgi:two-component system sensor histidine kinase BarA
MILVPTLLPALVLSSWLTRERVNDARAELESRGERESMYLANASELALLVGDSETLKRLAESNLRSTGAAKAVLFLDPEGAVLAAAGSAWEVGLARQCWMHAADCSGGEQRYLFDRAVQANEFAEDAAAFAGAQRTGVANPQLIGLVVQSFDPHALATIQRAMLLKSLLITIAALLTAAVLAQLFAQRLTEPIRRLSAVVARIRAGELGARTTPGGAGELRELEEGVNAMADRVEEASAELSRRVDEATVELSHSLIEGKLRNQELDRALVRAEAAARAKDLFLARMSHELRTPLNTVTGFAQLMHQSESPEQRADFYRAIAQSSGILIRTVDDILDFVKLESGAMHLERREFDLESCVEDAVMMQALVAKQKGLDLVCHFGRGLPSRVIGDSLRLSQVLGNLISNAIKFTHSGHVEVDVSALSARAGERRLLFEVRDTGIGIDAESVHNLFQPFAQADESMTRRFGGSGLGLSITSRIVEAFGGNIALHSEAGVGTHARVEIPLPLVEPQPDQLSAPVDARIWLLCASDSPHLRVLLDYLERGFAHVEIHDPAREAPSIWPPRHADLLVVVQGCGENWRAGTVPVLRLESIEALTAPTQQYLADQLPLPARRRELIAACLHRLPGASDIAEPLVTASNGARRRFNLSCLVVEDNELNRRMIATRLRDFGLRVDEAASGSAALECLSVSLPDLLLLDVHMPEMDGITLALKVREQFPGLPVYALTANVIGNEEQALRAAGVREVLYKPVDEERLLAVLAQHEAQLRGEFEILEHRGIRREEIVAEFDRLCARLGGALARDDTAAALDAAHQLLGAARMFSSGSLQALCLRIETRLREGEPVAEQFAALGAALEVGACRG